jgi:hypothetical protein
MLRGVQVVEEPVIQVDYEPREVISSAEARFERYRRIAGAVAGPISFVLMLYLLRNSGLTPAGKRLSAILVLSSVLWISEALPLPVTALLGAALAILLGVADARTVLAASRFASCRSRGSGGGRSVCWRRWD